MLTTTNENLITHNCTGKKAIETQDHDTHNASHWNDRHTLSKFWVAVREVESLFFCGTPTRAELTIWGVPYQCKARALFSYA